MARKTESETQKTREAILHAAEEIFIQKGYSGASMQDIGKRAGVTKSLIHHHFGSKGQLWSKIKAEAFSNYARHQAKLFAASQPRFAVVKKSLRGYFEFLERHPSFLKLMWWTQAEKGSSVDPDHDVEVKEQLDMLMNEGVQWIKRAQTIGEVREDLEPSLLFVACISMLRHWFVARSDYHLLQNDRDMQTLDERYLHTISEILTSGLKAKIPSQSPVD